MNVETPNLKICICCQFNPIYIIEDTSSNMTINLNKDISKIFSTKLNIISSFKLDLLHHKLASNGFTICTAYIYS